ncbi:MAG: YceI family protein [Pseudomonadota bacterium]
MKKSALISLPVFFFTLFLSASCAWSEPPAADSLKMSAFPGPGKWECTFKPDTSYISYFLKGNVHDTLGYVKKISGSASGVIAADGRLTVVAVKFTFAAETMDSKDQKRDERMKKKFMEINLYPDIVYRSTAAGAGLQDAGPVTQATKDHPLAFDLEGVLTVHGTTKAITIPVTVYPGNNLLNVEGKTILQLKDYAINNPSFFIFRTEDSVAIEFHIELQPANGTTP